MYTKHKKILEYMDKWLLKTLKDEHSNPNCTWGHNSKSGPHNYSLIFRIIAISKDLYETTKKCILHFYQT